jgi:hypothetical protein
VNVPVHNTLFIIAKMGVKPISKTGRFESHMWLLTDEEASMEQISLHREKSERAYRGGTITEVRDASLQEIAEHQTLMIAQGKEVMKTTVGRKVVVFQMDKAWKAIWPIGARNNPMAHKGTGYVEQKHVN